ncbi:HIT family protein [Hydrogenobacter thermophilus]|uniref:Histidine triad (HIT) protein n=1 Tax=Hydrogenobacter thermophilus (strain DSM 6534 / IAM 12695 / TK-6) TaxID=608538 RepID=D3DJJ2_HYDTT|nr:HIT domain-containing protein [Hydrogenobacter thermophilus]BAI69994.1 histidine triad (HIT) protein [Hydrogenobacter thermophilus TK-6]
MKMLWAPWRTKYVENIDQITQCFLCEAVRQPEERWREFLVLHRGRRAFVIFNKYPYNAGHLMVSPIEHMGDILSLDDETVLEMHKLTKACIRTLRICIKPHGFNLGYNLGRSAGAGLEDHIHLHIVPRWNGDTNFMPVLSETKVISQDLYELYDRIKPVFESVINAT